MKCIQCLCLLLLLGSCKPASKSLDYELLAEHSHDARCYTQGLEFYDGHLFESGGQYGESSVRRVDPTTGKVLKRRNFPASVFLEGLTVIDGELWLLTWKEKVAYVLDPESFELVRRHSYEGEGWGLTNNGTQLIMSDGSSTLTFRDPKNFAIIRTLQVTENGQALDLLNELEWVDGKIWANIYTEDRIVCIDAETGEVSAVMDCAALRERMPQTEVVAEQLNGIAHDRKTGHLWVSGKYWPLMFELKLSK